MISPEKIKWKSLKKGTDHIKPFKANAEKIERLMKEFLYGYLHLSDECRFPQYVRTMLMDLLDSRSGLNIIYDIDDFKGIVAFVRIRPLFKAKRMFVLLDKGMLRPSIIKESRKLIQMIMKEFKLKRMEAETADKKIVQLSKMVGFKSEGIQKNGFMFNKILMNNNPLSLVR